MRSPKAYFARMVNGDIFQNRSQLGLPNIMGLIVTGDARNGGGRDREGVVADIGQRGAQRPRSSAALQSQVVITCTRARRWVLGVEHAPLGTFIAAVGDLHHALAQGLMRREDVRGEPGEVVIGAKPARQNDREVIVFDSTGTSLQDAAAAAAVYERALAPNMGTPLGLWDAGGFGNSLRLLEDAKPAMTPLKAIDGAWLGL